VHTRCLKNKSLDLWRSLEREQNCNFWFTYKSVYMLLNGGFMHFVHLTCSLQQTVLMLYMTAIGLAVIAVDVSVCLFTGGEEEVT